MTFIVCMEFVPKKLAIIKANQKMIETASAFILYVNHPGNSSTMLEKIVQRTKKHPLPIINVAIDNFNQ